ncbi:ParB N-terminal domain-containing protein [Amycolatopsis arida]|uniref:ParB N-terminal domain-containing protein n=1 Tax=Amycolatopsis arida TaxID=587909 RepID=UPI000B839BDD
MLADRGMSLPPIVRTAPSWRVIDGMRRLRAAIPRGDAEIDVRLYDGDADDPCRLMLRWLEADLTGIECRARGADVVPAHCLAVLVSLPGRTPLAGGTSPSGSISEGGRPRADDVAIPGPTDPPFGVRSSCVLEHGTSDGQGSRW